MPPPPKNLLMQEVAAFLVGSLGVTSDQFTRSNSTNGVESRSLESPVSYFLMGQIDTRERGKGGRGGLDHPDAKKLARRRIFGPIPIPDLRSSTLSRNLELNQKMLLIIFFHLFKVEMSKT